MKKRLFLLLCPILAFTCKKSDTANNSITGAWELVEYSGTIPLTRAAPGTEIFTISANNYEIHIKDQPVQTGTYTIAKDPTIEQEVCLVVDQGQYMHSIVLNTAAGNKKVFFQIDGSELKTLSGCFAYDGGSYKKYVRIAGSTDDKSNN